jgi:5-methylcytosine-specific restriction protein A
MPSKPKHPCNYPGCPELAVTRYCDKHTQITAKQYNEQRGSATARGYDSRWQKARKVYLAKHPLCECNECKTMGRLLPATVVDHIIPHKGNKGLFWDQANWQAMSKKCHDRKTAREDGRWGRDTAGGASNPQ